jgi:tripartite-type tricarboxylate transporter receptor subunit TctC
MIFSGPDMHFPFKLSRRFAALALCCAAVAGAQAQTVPKTIRLVVAYPAGGVSDVVAPVSSVMYSPVLLIATPASKSKDFRALIADAKAQPGAVRWATSGPASLGHIVLEQVRATAGVDITHVPYKGGGQQLNDALGGQFEILSTNASPTLSSHVQSGKLRPLAVGAPARLESLPQVPTLGELGYNSANINSLFGVFAPAATPPALIAKYNAEINKALASPELRAKLTATDNVPTGGTPAAFVKEIASEFESNGRIIKAANIKAD